MNKYVCIHGHFYQPPRENAWLEAVEAQDSAYPYHDWNGRITAECYGPNTASRILGPDGRIIGILNNYSRISFNIGPTLLSWMEANEPEIYAAIIQADRISQSHYGGHGSAIAQAYNHMIMPLANARDKRTQIEWGVHDFKHRFGRKPEGMWLAETAVDTETLEILAEYGIAFTILAPRQAARARKIGPSKWEDVSGGRINPRRPYKCQLPSGKSIALFFYDGPISQGLAFEGLLNSGETYAHRLVDAIDEEDEDAQLVHVATDGESYGHHHHNGEMALAYCLHYLESQQLADVTIYAQFLEDHPPEWEAQIHEDSSWSCVHGVERWRSDCGCNTGHPTWRQQWRAPLRGALDWLRDELIPFFEEAAGKLLESPWAAREDYISVVLDRRPDNVEAFLERHARKPLNQEEKVMALRLLEMQRHAMFMYTSCGWFFDEISGIETTQVMQYAARAMQLAREVGGPDLEGPFQKRLEAAPSNIPETGNGSVAFERFVKPARVELLRVGAHYAVSSLFRDYEEQDHIYCFDVATTQAIRRIAGRVRFAAGKIVVRSRLTWAEAAISYAVLHLGDHNVVGGVRAFMGDEELQWMIDELKVSFDRGDVPEAIRALDRHFENHSYSLWHLFRDQQREIIDVIFQDTEESVENFYRQVYRNHYHLMQAIVATNNPLPDIFKTTAEFVLNRDLRVCLESLPIDMVQYNALMADIRKWGISVDGELLGYIGSDQISALVQELALDPLDEALLEDIETLLARYQELSAKLNLWYSQNIIYQIGRQQFFLRDRMAQRQEENAAHWVQRFKRVANMLGVKFD